jgi:hypothetical protein
MQIPFNIAGEEILLVNDGNSYALARRRERNRGDDLVTEIESFKWYVNRGAALAKLIDMKVKGSDARNLIELRKVIDQSRDEVIEAWKIAA